ncbi:ketosynthase chain-length factor [Kitasatospora sp. NBC_01250]|uniref:beta-ketoacyl synthase N-terminal-like domain-containing protein n=1 Tax=Kitasatospora sp. NBC_01250 TaxID=2903571 RepID=UPI002E33756B|nr:beta-ketoacyl synthase N-terminal-like domain-containing protein [Kitasatospora sp. NBC_01250]
MTTSTARPATGTAVVTGIGVAAPNGLGTKAWWESVREGRSGIRPLTQFDTDSYPAKLAGEVPGFDDAAHIPGRLLPQTDRMTRLALYAAAEALADARVDPSTLPDYAAGVVTASSAGGFEFGQRELQALWSQGSEYVSVYQSFAWFYAVNSGQISIRHQFRGPSAVVVSGDAGGLDAMAQARRHLRRGTRLMISGGIDSALCPWGWTARLAGGGLSPDDRPAAAYRPFAGGAGGYVAGEGGALLVLEDAATARDRGATVYGAVTGCGAAFDPTGDQGGLRRAAEAALTDAGISAAEVDAVFADAAGMPEADRAEADAIRELFGPYGVPVTAPKTMTGRLAAGGAALDLAAAMCALRDQVVPPTIHTTPAPEHTLDLVTGTPRPAELRHLLVLARERGGFHSACVVSSAG